MGQIDIACRECHKLIWQFMCGDSVSGYWSFVAVCGKCDPTSSVNEAVPDDTVEPPQFDFVTEGGDPGSVRQL